MSSRFPARPAPQRPRVAWPTALALAIGLSAIAPCSAVTPLTGTFLDAGSITLEPTVCLWSRDFAVMQAVGCSLLVVQSVAQDTNALYPSSLAWLHGLDWDPLESIMTAADRCGMKVQLGSFSSSRWGQSHADPAYLEALADTVIGVCEDLYERYSLHPSLTGWYLAHELPNARYLAPLEDVYARFFNRQAMWLHSRTLLPCSIAPWFDSTSLVFMSPGETGKFWRNVLARCQIDILMLQDGVGCHRFRFDPDRGRYDNVREYFEQVKMACDSQIRPRAFWADLEVFSMDRDDPHMLWPGDIDTIAVQLAMEQDLAQKLVAFELIGFLNPSQGPWPASLYSEYRALLQGRTNLAPGRAYSCTRPSLPQYPDLGQLTDGRKIEQATALVGWEGDAPFAVNVGLAAACSIAEVKCHFLQPTGGLARFPDSVQFSSEDGGVLTYLGTSTLLDSHPGLKSIRLTVFPEQVSRGIQVRVYPSRRMNVLTLMSEIEIIGAGPRAESAAASGVQNAAGGPAASRFILLNNPCRDLLRLRLPTPSPELVFVSVYDVLGRRVAEFRVRPGAEPAVLDVASLRAGLYFLFGDNKPGLIAKFTRQR